MRLFKNKKKHLAKRNSQAILGSLLRDEKFYLKKSIFLEMKEDRMNIF